MITKANNQKVLNEPSVVTDDGQRLRIGAVASQTGVTVEALRYYERLGLLRPVRRGSGGYREYGADAPDVVRFIRRAQSLAFTLVETLDLVRLREAAWGGVATHVLRDAVVAKIEDVDRRIRDLRDLRKELADHIAACDSACPVVDNEVCDGSIENVTVLPAADCPLVQALESPVSSSIRPLTAPSKNRRGRGANGRPLEPGPRGDRQGNTPVHVSSRSSRSTRRPL